MGRHKGANTQSLKHHDRATGGFEKLMADLSAQTVSNPHDRYERELADWEEFGQWRGDPRPTPPTFASSQISHTPDTLSSRERRSRKAAAKASAKKNGRSKHRR